MIITDSQHSRRFPVFQLKNRRVRAAGGKRYLKVTEHRTKRDWALFMQEVLEEHYPDATTVVLVMDNLISQPTARPFRHMQLARLPCTGSRTQCL